MHLDLKPENILYEDEDYYKICDFGCSQLYQSLSRISNMNISPKKSSFPVYFD
jgi:serine/threonine protein kinase